MESSNYNFFEKALHRFIFSYSSLNKSFFELEKIFYDNDDNINIDNKHIFISSLPRSGTTMLLNALYSTNEFASLTYKDMPFILSPNINKLIFKKSKVIKKQRFHNDKTFFSTNSPESFDEVFFQNFTDTKIDDFNRDYKLYISLILKSYKKKRYLSKNNNNFKRSDLIRKNLKNAIFISMLRNPTSHAKSLYNQHLNFKKLQEKDVFILEYMNFLGHNEFGLNHKSWFQSKKYTDFNDRNYWLEQWYLFYSNIIKKDLISFILYEKFCEDINYRKKIKEKLNISSEFNIDLFENKSDINNYDFDIELLKKCHHLYNQISNHINCY